MRVFLFFIFTFGFTFLNAQSWQWARGSTGAGTGSSVFIDAGQNVLVSGSFDTSITFNGIGLTNAGGAHVFIAKYSRLGNITWAKNIGGSRGSAITADQGGNIIVTGTFTNTAITIGSYTLVNSGGSNQGGTACCDLFVAKLDSNGNVLWATSAGGTGDDYPSAVSTDAGGNIVVTGNFDSPTLIIGQDTLVNTAGPYASLFIIKYNANGNPVWSRCNDAYETPSLCTDAAGYIYVTGEFWSTITFGAYTLTTPGSNVFIVKYSPGGSVIWATCPRTQSRAGGTAVSADGSGNLFVGGWFNSANIIFGNDTLLGNNGPSPFIAKLDANGNTQWARSAGTAWACSHYCQSVSATSTGGVWASGYFEDICGSITFGADTLAYVATNCMPACFPLFIVKYDGQGNLLCADALPDGANSYTQINADAAGNACVTGTFYAMPLIVGQDTLPSPGGNHVLVAKYNCSATSAVATLDQHKEVTVFPNPCSGEFTIQAPQLTHLKVYDLLGNCLLEKNCSKEPHLQINLGDKPAGIYFAEITMAQERSIKKIIIN